jgi:hypothetical protein
MKKRKSYICHYYERRINDEIAAGQFATDHVLTQQLKNICVTSEAKKTFGIPDTRHITMLDINKKAVEVLPRIRFMYLLSLLEAFFKDYICERDQINIAQIETHLQNEKSSWARVSNNNSTSFYHIPYALFIMSEKYGLEISSHMNKATFEAGVLRNCVVHHDGKVVNQYFLSGLKETATFQGNILSVNEFIVINKKLITLYINEARNIIDLLNY